MPRSHLPHLIMLSLLLPGLVQASVPDGAQPRRSIYVSLYGFPGAGLSVDAEKEHGFPQIHARCCRSNLAFRRIRILFEYPSRLKVILKKPSFFDY